MNSSGSQGGRQTRIEGGPLQIAVLDDYQRAALSLADWPALASRASITVFHGHLPNADDVVQRLMPFHVVCVMRERTPLRPPAQQALIFSARTRQATGGGVGVSPRRAA